MTLKHSLQREVFTISREMEYLTADELEKQTGYSRAEWWPRVIGKETIDNGLDNCEQVGVSPEITVFFDGKKLEISDNGGGIPAEIVKRLSDFTTRTSDKLAYVSPTRGAQGNAWKTLLAMPYVLDGERACPVVIEACLVRHEIRIRTDQIARRPVVDYQQQPLSVQSGGTAIIFGRLQARLEDVDENPENVPRLVSDYALFNPHAAFRLNNDVFPARDPQWRKWSPRDPTPPHWYTLDRFEELVASMVSTGKARTVRDFLADFRGLTRTSTRMNVLAAAGLERGAKLEDLVDKKRGAFDKKALARLLTAMQQNSKEVAPEVLGVLGKRHFEEKLAGEDQSFRYAKQSGSENGLPYIVEAACRLTDDELLQGLHVGLNWSVPLSNPLQDCALPGQSFAYGLEGFLQHLHVEVDQDPIALVLHIASPRFDFLDRGKGSVHLGPSLAGAVAETVSKVVKEWASIKKARDRERRGEARRREEALRKGRPEEVTIIDAAFEVMAEAYLKASGSGRYPATARQVMYAARPHILEATGRDKLDDVRFTQELLPRYQREHPQETAGWDVTYDERGHLVEPHTERRIGIGTLAVREYLAEAAMPPTLGSIKLPDLSFKLETTGPRHRYGGILFIEKEGFFPLLERAQIGERYDLALMSTKGVGSTSARQLIERLAAEARIFVLHDFDKSGFSIVGILGRDTTRYQFTTPPEVIDLGLRLADVNEYALQSEPVDHDKTDPASNLHENGATDEEIEFLAGEADYAGRYHNGRRVELNAFTSDQFIEWLEAKLRLHGVKKVIPDGKTLAEAYRRSRALNELDDHIRQALPEMRTNR